MEILPKYTEIVVENFAEKKDLAEAAVPSNGMHERFSFNFLPKDLFILSFGLLVP